MATDLFNGDSASIGALQEWSNNPGAGEHPNNRFSARNFRLDENVTADRAAGYHSIVGSLGGSAFSNWRGLHRGYLMQLVNRGEGEAYRLDEEFDPTDMECPETFRDPSMYAKFGALDGQVRLLHCVTLDFLRLKIGATTGSDGTVANIVELAERAAPLGTGDTDAVRQLDEQLTKWHRTLDRRPAFVTYLQHVSDLFGDVPANDQPEWPNILRDRLGLMHFDRGTEFILFSYQVGELCHLTTDPHRHPLLIPTVIDQPLSWAFCPAPKGTNEGLTVDLGETGQLTPELVHPALRLTAQHVFRIGRITRSVPDDLGGARQAHLAALRSTTGRVDYALDSDAAA